MMRGTIDLFQTNRFDSAAANVIDPEEVDTGRLLAPPSSRLFARFRATFGDL